MIIKNYIYNLLYQVLTILLPIITIPYVSRVLGANGLGIYALSTTYAQYFVMFGMIGLLSYSSREIAYVRDNDEKLNEVFWELNFIRFITMGLSTVLYIIIFIFTIKSSYKIIYIFQMFIVLSAFIDISWFFIGIEDFKKVIMKDTTIKLIGVILIFIFVRREQDIYLYCLILALSQFTGQIIMWLQLPKFIRVRKVKFTNCIKHLKFSIALFIPQIAVTVYTMLDKVMLGIFSSDAQVGMYDNSQKIIKILITIVTSLAVVTIPKMSNLYKNGKNKEFSQNVYKSFSFVSFLAFPMTFGLMGICRNFISWFYGPGFEGIESMFYFGSWLMITLAWSSIVGSQVLISIKREKMFTIAVTTGAIVNVIFNFILIKKFEGVGTTISSVIAEFTGMFIMVYFVRDIVNPRKLFKAVPKYFISSFIMFIVVWILGEVVGATIVGTIIQSLAGVFVYFGIMAIIKDSNLMYALSIVRNKISSKKQVEEICNE